MALKEILILFLFTSVVLGSLLNPMYGIVGYLAYYHINPEQQWWGLALSKLDIRIGFTIVVMIAIGTIINKNKLRYTKLLHSQEILLIILVMLTWLSKYIGLEADTNIEPTAYPPLKMTKIAITVLLFTHIVTDLKRYKVIIWTFVILGFYLGYSCYTAPPSAFIQGRLSEGIGGSDFAESSFLAAHFMAILPFIAVLVLTGNWKDKTVAIFASAFVINGIILTRTRAAFVAAIIGGFFALIWSVPDYRKKIVLYMLIGVMGMLTLADQKFWDRMKTIETHEEDTSATGREDAWATALKMIEARPQGFGAGNFGKYMAQYSDYFDKGIDTHNTFLKCGAELGVHGLIVFIMMVINAFLILRRVKKRAAVLTDGKKFIIYAYALHLTLIIYWSCGIFMSQNYHEVTYWFLLLPVSLERALENTILSVN